MFMLWSDYARLAMFAAAISQLGGQAAGVGPSVADSNTNDVAAYSPAGSGRRSPL